MNDERRNLNTNPVRLADVYRLQGFGKLTYKESFVKNFIALSKKTACKTV